MWPRKSDALPWPLHPHHSVSAPSIFSPPPALQSLLLGLFSGLLSTASHSPRPPTAAPLTVRTSICRDINLIARGPAVGRILILHILVFLNKTSRSTLCNLNTASATCLCVFRIAAFYNSGLLSNFFISFSTNFLFYQESGAYPGSTAGLTEI